RLLALGERGENFVIWKTQLKSQIMGMGTARYINGCATAPVEPTLPDKADDAAKAAHRKALEEGKNISPRPLGAAGTRRGNELLDEWEKNNIKIRTLFFATSYQTRKIRIANHLSARESWNELCKMDEHQGEL
ncbi:hypothetical protein K438DRAFT_1467452, partial [Mycena galopus ATCC 62051]